MECAEISLRLAKEDDFQDVLEMSVGIYAGFDYLPLVFHEWLKTPNKYVFVAELQGKPIGLLAATMIDGGQTILCRGLRIHRGYRGRGYSYQIMTGVIDRVSGIYPRASKVRFLSYIANLQISSLAKRLNYKTFLEKNEFLFHFSESNSVALRNKYREYKELYELRGKDAVEFVLHRRQFDSIIPKKTLVVLLDPYEMIPANAGFLFKDGDKMFTDVSTEELRKDVLPRSFSHGRMEALVKVQRWICNIYTKEQDAFKAHLIRQLMAAIEQLQSHVEREKCFVICCSKNLEFNPKDVLKEVLELEEDANIENNVEVLYEKYME